jgi:hypothetical protein
MINLSEDGKPLLDMEYNTSNHKVEIEKERLVKLELYYEFKKDFVVFINFDEIVVSDDLIDVGRFDLKTSIEDIIKEIYKNMKIVKNSEYFKQKYEGSLNSLKSKSDFFYEFGAEKVKSGLKTYRETVDNVYAINENDNQLVSALKGSQSFAARQIEVVGNRALDNPSNTVVFCSFERISKI